MGSVRRRLTRLSADDRGVGSGISRRRWALLLVAVALAQPGSSREARADPGLEPASVAEKRRAILQSSYARLPARDLVAVFVATEGPELPTLYLTLALRKREALPVVLEALEQAGPIEKRKIAKLLQYTRWPEALPGLLALARSDSERELSRVGALYALAAIGPRPVAEQLIALLERPGRSPTEKRVIIAALARSAYPGAVPPIRNYLEHEDILVRLFAARALGELGSPVDRRMLFEALQHDHHRVREEACGALGAFPGPDVLAALDEVAQDDPRAAVRLAAKKAMSRSAAAGLSQAEAALHFQGLLSDPDYRVRTWAVDFLAGECGEPGKKVLSEVASLQTPEGIRSTFQLLLLSAVSNPLEQRGEEP